MPLLFGEVGLVLCSHCSEVITSKARELGSISEPMSLTD